MRTGPMTTAAPIEVEPVDGEAEEPTEAGGPPPSLIGRVADLLTVLGVLLAPIYGKGVGGITGIAYSDIALAFAAIARGVHLLTVGFRMRTVRRHSFLLGMMSLFAVLALISAFANRSNPLALGYVRVVVATLGSVILVATHGDQGPGARRQLLIAFGLGCIMLSLSSFTGYRLQGRSLGWSLHPNALGHSCMMGAATCTWLWDNTKTRYLRWFWAGAVLLNLVGIMNSGSRGGLIGIFVGIMIYVAMRGNARLYLVGIVAALGIAIVLAAGIVHLPSSNPIERLLTQGQQNSDASYSDAARSQLFNSDIQRIDKSPWFGDGFADIINVHVAYLQGWVAAGAFAGLVSMVIGLAMLALPLLVRRRDLALACGTAAVATAWVFTNIFTARDQWLFMALAFSTALPITALGPSGRKARLDPEPTP